VDIGFRAIVFEDRDPQSPGRHVSFPHMQRLSDGRLMVACRVGSGKDSANGRVHLLESRDEGQMWRSLGFPFPSQLGRNHCEQRCGLISEPEPGHLCCTLAYCERNDPSLPMCNPKTGGLLPFHVILSQSTDGGRNWSALREVDVSPFIQPSLCSPVTKVADGSWLIGFETNKSWDDSSKWFAQSCMIRSTDGGAN
jgi:hypothetical protein